MQGYLNCLIYSPRKISWGCSEERARRISSARSERAEDYRFSRMAHAARQQLEQREAAEAAAAEAGEAGSAQRPEVSVLVKADVQVRLACCLPSGH